MSRISKGSIASAQKRSSKSSIQKPGGSKAPGGKGGKAGAGKDGKGAKGGEEEKEGPKEFGLPAFSIVPQKKKEEINWERLKRDTIRRLAPEGEDIKEIRRILKEIQKQKIPIHEFINLVSPYTGDNGSTLRTIMAEDLDAFRKLARKVYETMTQDVSDVLINEQLQTVEYYQEKQELMTQRMMNAINEIYEMIPGFDFERFLRGKEEYLNLMLPLPAEVQADDEGVEMQRRQAAYHRLQWLRSEGERMNEENKRLQRKLDELKRDQQMEQSRAAEVAAEAEAKRQELIEQETEMQKKLEDLNQSVDKSFVATEAQISKEHNKTAMEPPPKKTGAVRKTIKKKIKKPEWASVTAGEIEETAVKEGIAAEARKAPSSTSRTSFKRPKKRSKSPHFSPIKTPPPREPPKPASPFHYSPPKTPPQEEAAAFSSFGRARPPPAPRQSSPFHYSPPKTPPRQEQPPAPEEAAAFGSFGRARPPPQPRQTSPFHYSPPKSPPGPQVPQAQETRIEEVSTKVQQKRPQPKIRPSMAPKDTWGGFF